jgi:hypothetical protein
MTISTIVTWSALLGDEILTTVEAKAAEMAAQGKTDNIPVSNPEQDWPPIVTTRTWTTVADAEEWVAFVETYGPQSATIEQT